MDDMQNNRIITASSINRRNYWVNNIKQTINTDFVSESSRIETEVVNEVNHIGTEAIIDHLRLCGNIPESYTHDSTEEKLYSKYTDIILSEAFKILGLKSVVLTERGDAADVEVYGREFSFVADAKAFRLSRTAKNQKDFKVQAMDSWKKGKPFAIVICPIYQLPNKSSQIYEQAIRRNVCILTYSHLSLLVNFAAIVGCQHAEKLLYLILNIVPALNPSKSAVDYWLAINRTILNYSNDILELWQNEKQAAYETILAAKDEALCFLAAERERIARMSHEEAIRELIKMNKIDSKVKAINSIVDNGIFNLK